MQKNAFQNSEMNNNSATDSSSTSSKAENAPRPSSSRSNVSGSGQQFFLRWNNYQNNLCSVFDRLLQNEDFVDVTLTTEGKALKCHKVRFDDDDDATK